MTYIDGINADAMDQFLGALESGKYKQGSHKLHRVADDAMCCLGVATLELGTKCGVKLTDVERYDDARFYLDENSGVRYYLLMPPPVTALLGIPELFIDHTGSGDVILVDYQEGDLSSPDDMEIPGIPYEREGRQLVAVSSLNDRGVPFAVIARRIRETLSKPKYVDGINQENFDKFLSDLRSGDFKQGKHKLEQDDQFCCLGVASNRAWREGVAARHIGIYGTISYDTSASSLSVSVAEWLGLPSTHLIGGTTSFDVAFFKQGYEEFGDNLVHTAVGWNDSLNKSFVEIADAFEKEFTRED